MKYIFFFITMLFLHIIDDFHCQGLLGQMKQKSFWEKVCKDYNTDKYKNDYIICLILHGFEWTFTIMIPIFIYMYLNNILMNEYLIMLFIVNIVIHVFTDHLKCNKLCMNLIQDQLIHIIQIIWTIIMIAITYYI